MDEINILDCIIQFTTIFFVSALKFGVGTLTAINSKIGIVPSIAANLTGGALGVYLYTKFGIYIKHKYIHWKYHRHGNYPKIMTPRNRKLVRFKNRFGFYGIALAAPVVTVPVAVFMALTLTDNKRKIAIFIYGACVLWAIQFFVLDYFFDIDLFQWIKQLLGL
jgi:hypothetical protein